MITFLICLTILIVGYFTYGKLVGKIVGHDDNKQTPAHRLKDGVDFVSMPWYRVFLIQFLNIAGTGPIFGAISGALFGPVAFLWITFGALFAGATHDLLSGYISMKHDGASVTELFGFYLGNKVKTFMRGFSVVLLVLVGTVFIASPAGLLANLTGVNITILTFAIVAYYLIATVLPVDKIIGKVYPLFGFAMLAMAVGLLGAMIIGSLNGSLHMQEMTFSHIHPANLSPFPFLFVTIACGAISGFHATQSPMMARCVNKESETKRIFYGSMVIEGVVALVWCAVTIAFLGSSFNIGEIGGPSAVVNEVSFGLLGPVGMVLAVLGVVAAPITSGDTAFRSARLVIADAFKMEQRSVKNRFILAIPLFAIGIALTFVDFNIIWRYFAFANQFLAMVMLWTGSVWLFKNGKTHWIASLPASFMTYVAVSYIIQAPEGFQLPGVLGNTLGILTAIGLLGWFVAYTKKNASAVEIETMVSEPAGKLNPKTLKN